MPDVFSLPLQFVLVESINRLLVAPDEASAKVFTGEEEVGRGEEAPLLEEAVPLEPIPDVKPEDDGCSCCQGGMLSLLLSKRFASSKEIFLLSIICLARRMKRSGMKSGGEIRSSTLLDRAFAASESAQRQGATWN